MKTHWLVILFVALTDLSTHLRQKLWRWLYNKIATRDTSGKFIFMNYGYAAENTLPLKPEDEPFRYFIQLYNFVIADVSIENKDVLEVGCGRGGGGSFISRYKNPHSYIGVDFSETAIAWCKQHFSYNNTSWMQGMADALPIANESMDVVINVESSHCYPSMEKFLSEVHRTLTPNGYFAFCDLRRLSEIDSLDKAIADSQLRLIKKQEITAQVLKALDHVSANRNAEITAMFPAFLHSAIRDFAAIKDTTVYNMLNNGKMKYFHYLLQKH